MYMQRQMKILYSSNNVEKCIIGIEIIVYLIRKGILKVFSPCVIYLDYFGIKILMR